MSIQEFFDTYVGKGIDFDGFYGNQCMDEFLQYNQDVIHAPRVYGNAVDVWTNYPTAFYDQIPNTPDGVPNCGDVMIWGTGIGQYGHIAIVRDANVNEFTSLDQNWNSVQTCEFITHSYAAVLGWLRPKIFEPQSAPIEVPQPEPQPVVDPMPPEPIVQSAPEPVVSATNTDIPITVTTTSGETTIPVTTTSTTAGQSATFQVSTENPTPIVKTTSLPKPISKPWRLSDLIVWIAMNIKRVLIG